MVDRVFTEKKNKIVYSRSSRSRTLQKLRVANQTWYESDRVWSSLSTSERSVSHARPWTLLSKKKKYKLIKSYFMQLIVRIIFSVKKFPASCVIFGQMKFHLFYKLTPLLTLYIHVLLSATIIRNLRFLIIWPDNVIPVCLYERVTYFREAMEKFHSKKKKQSVKRSYVKLAVHNKSGERKKKTSMHTLANTAHTRGEKKKKMNLQCTSVKEGDANMHSLRYTLDWSS